MGLEVGAVITYSANVNGINTGFTQEVLNEVEGYSGVFKTGIIISGDATPIGGDYYGIEENAYYDRGSWEIDEQGVLHDYFSKITEPPYEGIYVTNPIPDGFRSDEFGSCLGKEIITTPGGVFEAYKFHDERTSYDDYTWFVPYLGRVKYYSEEKENGEIVSKSSIEIISYSFSSSGSDAAAGLCSAGQSASIQNINPDVATKLRKIFRR